MSRCRDGPRAFLVGLIRFGKYWSKLQKVAEEVGSKESRTAQGSSAFF